MCSVQCACLCDVVWQNEEFHPLSSQEESFRQLFRFCTTALATENLLFLVEVKQFRERFYDYFTQKMQHSLTDEEAATPAISQVEPNSANGAATATLYMERCQSKSEVVIPVERSIGATKSANVLDLEFDLTWLPINPIIANDDYPSACRYLFDKYIDAENSAMTVNISGDARVGIENGVKKIDKYEQENMEPWSLFDDGLLQVWENVLSICRLFVVKLREKSSGSVTEQVE